MQRASLAHALSGTSLPSFMDPKVCIAGISSDAGATWACFARCCSTPCLLCCVLLCISCCAQVTANVTVNLPGTSWSLEGVGKEFAVLQASRDGQANTAPAPWKFWECKKGSGRGYCPAVNQVFGTVLSMLLQPRFTEPFKCACISSEHPGDTNCTNPLFL
eukprot:1159828-Pelagomonas_calceolata.AAC.9